MRIATRNPQAPPGFTCVPFTLGPPPVDGFLATDLLVQLAVEQGGTRDFAPIPLGADGSTTHGVALESISRHRPGRARGGRGRRAARRRQAPAGARARGLTVVAYPLKCGDRVVTPTAIDVVPRQGPPVPRQAGPSTGAESRNWCPG